jgi:hypothetical protein
MELQRSATLVLDLQLLPLSVNFNQLQRGGVLMKQSITVLAMLIAFGMISVSNAADPSAKSSDMGTASASAAQTVKGEVLKIDGDNYTIKDASGKEVRVHVDKSTKSQGALKVGDKVEAETTAEGHATSIKAAK